MKTKKETLLVLTDVISILQDVEVGESSYAVFEERVPPLGGPPPHTHPDEEVFYILEGEFEFILNDIHKPFSVLPGSVVHVPSNALHTFKNIGGTQGKMVVILTPGNLLHYFREIGTQIHSTEELPELDKVPDLGKIDIAKALECAGNHDINFILPTVISS